MALFWLAVVLLFAEKALGVVLVGAAIVGSIAGAIAFARRGRGIDASR
jgi:hypothetical protein